MIRRVSVVAAFLLLAAALPLLAVERSQRTVVDDVIRMAAAGVSDDAIISFVQKTDDRFNITADDVIAMTDAKVSSTVIKAVVAEANNRGERRAEPAPATRVYVSPYVSAYPYPYYYDPFYYDPFWYGPRVYLNFGLGLYRGGYHYGPGFGGHHRGRR